MGADPRGESAGNRPPPEEAIRAGLEGRAELRVGEGDLAAAMGNPGAEVLATPILIGLLEQASASAVRPLLPAGTMTVGIRVDIRHLAATPPGLTVVARSRLREVDGRRLLFDVEAHDGLEKVAEGVHERFVVDEERFLARTREKRRKGGG
ncbi:MAG: thioesterase family protein [Nitrospinota bacterium]